MKIFEFDSADDMRDGAVARQVGGDGNPVEETEDQRNARIAQESVASLVEAEKEAEQKFEDQNHGLKFAIRPIRDFCVGKIEFPLGIIAEVNEHIDDVVIPKGDSFADGLVGQLKNDEKSAQLNFPLDDEVGKQLRTVFNQIGTTYLKQGWDRDSKAEVFQAWTNHMYTGDYNPVHDHGAQTLAGVSGFLVLKVPQCVEALDATPAPLNNASGSIDGFTHLIWGQNSRRDVLSLYPQTEDYVKPIVGTMLIFPCWMKHQVIPFFGEGERRTLAVNWNVRDSDQEIMKYLSARELENFRKHRAAREAALIAVDGAVPDGESVT